MSDFNSAEVALKICRENRHISDFESTNKTNTRWKLKPITLVRFPKWNLKDFNQSIERFIERTIVGSNFKFPILREVKNLGMSPSDSIKTFFNSITDFELKLNLILSMELMSYTEASNMVEKYYDRKSNNYSLPKEKFHDLIWFVKCYTVTDTKEDIPEELVKEIMEFKYV